MTNIRRKIATLVATALLAVAPGRAQETNQVVNVKLPEPTPNPIQCSVKGEWFNKYIFRNMPFSENPIAQGTASATYKDFSLIGLGIYDTKVRDFIEADVIGDITHNFGPISASAGYARITVPNAKGLDTQEFYLGLTGNCPGTPSFKWTRDFEMGKGDYFELSAGHQIDLNKILSLKGTASVSADNHYYSENSGLRALTVGLEAPVKLDRSGTLTFTPKVQYQKPLRNEFRPEWILGAGLEKRF